MSHHLGEVAGILASLTWSISCLIFSKANAPAGALNLFKNCVAAVLFTLTVAVTACWRGGPFLNADAGAIGWLSLSALVGIVIGDIFYFRSLQILGPRRSLVLTTVAPPLAGALGWAVLGERLSGPTGLCILVTLAGVAIVVTDPQLQSDSPGFYPGSRRLGVAYGFAGSACQALQSVLSKLGMERGVSPLEASCFRLVTAALMGIAGGLALRRLGAWKRAIFASGEAPRLALASTCGTYGGIWLSLIAFSQASLGVATTLTALSPVFVLPIARVILGLRMSPRAVFGAAVALTGVLLLFRG